MVDMTVVIQEDVPLAKRTTIGLGGMADQLIACKSVADIQEALAYARDKDMPIHVLGGGSNTIFADAGFRGVVLAVQLRGIAIRDDGLVTTAAGEPWDELVQQTIAAGLGGFEALSGIPGLVGATPMQNVGAYGQQVSDVIVTVEAIERATGAVVTFDNDECAFEYRGSRFKYADADRYIITSVTYQLDSMGAPTVKYPQLREKITADGVKDLGHGTAALATVREATLSLRRSKSMVVDPSDPNSRSCGSFFINPVLTLSEYEAVVARATKDGVADEVPQFPAGDNVKIPAAWLIEHAGFSKGERRGGVGISENHPLALVNHDGTTEELLQLAEEIQQGVAKQFGVELVREPVLVT